MTSRRITAVVHEVQQREEYIKFDLFISMPSLEAFKFMLSWGITERYSRRGERYKFSVNDVRNAHLRAKLVRATYTELPDEFAEQGFC